MSLHNGDYMRILTPETTDGQNLRIVNDRVVYRESHMPFNEIAKKAIEQENLRLPPHLRHKIEIVLA